MSKFAGFNSVQLYKPKKSTFDLSHQKRSSTRMGRLTPVMVTECIPGDVFNGSSEILLRLAPLLAPIYDQIRLYVHFYFVPHRLLWEDWEEFITGGRLGTAIDPIEAPIPPSLNINNILTNHSELFAKSSLADYLGCPMFGDVGSGSYGSATIDAIPFAAYQLIWMEYYRDRNFVPDDELEIEFPLASGPVSTTLDQNLLQLRTRSYEHDYFTSALPFTQRGAEVLMPMSGTGSVTYLNESRFMSGGSNASTGAPAIASSGQPGQGNYMQDGAGNNMRVINISGIDFEGSNVSINDFRSAYALQVWLERNALGGSRYTESTQAHFGVRPKDSRLQRPEYIGGGRINVRISEVVSTAYSDDGEGTVPLANMAGHGVTYGDTNEFRYYCTEHGIIMGIASIMAPASYHQGLPRMFRRRSFLDYPWPTFAKLGEQEVYKYELWASPGNLTGILGILPVFGYQSRYADWKHIHNSNHGDFHDTLLFWTLTRNFSDDPELSAEFNEFDDSTQDRIFAVNTGDNFWMYIHNKLRVNRCLPYFGTPNTLNF